MKQGNKVKQFYVARQREMLRHAVSKITRALSTKVAVEDRKTNNIVAGEMVVR